MITRSDTKFLVLALSALLGIFGVAYSLLIDRMNKQETIAAQEITALREEIKTTKADAKDAVSAAAVASKDSVAATAAALKDAVAATAAASKDSVAAISTALNDKQLVLSQRIDKLEDKMNEESRNHRKGGPF